MILLFLLTGKWDFTLPFLSIVMPLPARAPSFVTLRLRIPFVQWVGLNVREFPLNLFDLSNAYCYSSSVFSLSIPTFPGMEDEEKHDDGSRGVT